MLLKSLTSFSKLDQKVDVSVSDNGVLHLTKEDCQLLITYFDTDSQGGLSYKQ